MAHVEKYKAIRTVVDKLQLEKEVSLQGALKHRHLIELHLFAFLELCVNPRRHVLIGQRQDLDDVIAVGRRVAERPEQR